MDPTKFRQRFAAWKAGNKVYDAGKPIEDDYLPVVKYYTEKDLDKLFGTYNTPFVKDNNIVPIDQNYWNSNKNDPEMRKNLTEWINELMTDNKVSVDGGELGNVVVTPTKQDKKILRLFKKAIPNKQIRNTIYEDLDVEDEFLPLTNKTLSQNEKVRNIVSIWQMSGNPSTYNGILDFFARYPGTSDRRPNYNMWNNSIGNIGFNYDLGALDDYLAELSHAYLFSKYAPKKIRENLLTRFLSLPGDIKINGKDGYSRPGNLEYNAHSIIEPAIRDYIQYEKYPSVLSLNDRIDLVNLAEEQLRNAVETGTKSAFFKSIKHIPKYDGGTDDKTYLPEYEYEATVTPQGTSLEKHKRITNEEDWLKYWGNVGAGYVNLALEKAAPVILNGMSMLMGNPVGALAGIAGGIAGEDVGAHFGTTGRIIGGLVGGIMSDKLINFHNAFNPGLFKTKLDLKYPTLAKVQNKANLSDLNVPKLSSNHWVRGNGYILGHDASLYRDKILAAEKDASNFLKKDVYPRFKRNLSHTIITNPSMLGKYGMPDVDVYYADMTNTPWGGYAHYKQSLDDVPYIVADVTTDSEKLARTLTHEIEHHTRNVLNGDATFDNLISNSTDIGDDVYKNMTPIGKTEGLLLRDAYIFDEDPRFYPGKINRMRERGATNRELRHAISLLPNDKPIYYEDLDHLIDNASDEALMSLLRFGNGYSKSFYKELVNRGPSASKQILQNMRDALKYVPGIIPTAIIGASAEQAYLLEHDKGKSIHINPANRGKFNATKKRTGKTTEQLAHSKNPLTRKRAIFALNARKWKH